MRSPELSRILEQISELTQLTGTAESRVRIRTKDRCPKCKGKFQETPLGLICPKCITTPRRYYVYLSWKGRKIKVYSFRDGQPLSSWELAKRACEIIAHEIESGTFDPSRWVRSDVRRFLFEKQWSRWLEIKAGQVERGELSPGYLAQIRSYQWHILPFFKDKDVRDLKRADITDFRTLLERENLSPKTVSNILNLLQGFLRFLKAEEIINHVPHFPQVRVLKHEPEVLSREEHALLLDYIRQNLPEHFPIMMFIIRQGVRPGEACALLWEDVDLARGFVWIRRTFSARTLRETTKGRKARLIPLDPEVYEFFKEYVRKVAPFPKNFVFVQANGAPYKDYSLNRIWKRIKSGLSKALRDKKDPVRLTLYAKINRGLTLYAASRHSRLTQFVADGKPLPLVQTYAGHSDPRITERYVHLAADKLKQLFDEEPGQKVSPLPRPKNRK